ncbi:hypothetical protein AVEN_83124-1 [Araneus ventricosus]|uniref:Pre-C2HC domain-containing protein n=1 Tax=Araneus ventricosus TaxID=182803 RepID=A0A4Y2ANG3_ARAVE|nr:hypothetical protein AVEN_83124-1 [Araneus ventricosus]
MPGMRHPSIIIYDVPISTEFEDAQRAIQIHPESKQDLKIRFRLKGRKENTNHLNLEAPSPAFHKLKNLGGIAINWNMYQLKEFVHIKRCTTCQAFTHTANSGHCKNVTPFCGCCGGRHYTWKCRSREDFCINCSESNRPLGTNRKTDHRAVDL